MNGLVKKQQLIRDYYQKLKMLNAQKSAIQKDINTIKLKFEELIEIEADLDQLQLFENMDDFLAERANNFTQ
jgi:hypothetical protein